MSLQWHQQNATRWAKEVEIAARLLKNSRAEIDKDGIAVIYGDLFFEFRDGSKHGPFHLKITYPKTFPADISAPNIFMLNNPYKWENVEDSHIESDWRLCLGVPVEMQIDFRDQDSLQQLLEKTVTFFVLEIDYQKDLFRQRIGGPKAKWRGDQRSHGSKGIAQAIKNKKWKISRDGNKRCPCGGDLKFKRCHGPVMVQKGLL